MIGRNRLLLIADNSAQISLAVGAFVGFSAPFCYHLES